MEATCSSETSVDFNGPHGDIFQKIVFFITTAENLEPYKGLISNCHEYKALLYL
jgi:hypothetical protein